MAETREMSNDFGISFPYFHFDTRKPKGVSFTRTCPFFPYFVLCFNDKPLGLKVEPLSILC